ncbi:MAG TPA: sensor histidine kinase [Pseudonocardiaceae bacterium]
MRPRQRALTAIGVAGLLARVAYVIRAADGTAVLSDLYWTAFGVLPMFAVAVWLVRRRPGHPQAHRLLLLAVAMAVGVGVEGPLRQMITAIDPGRWLAPLNLVGQYCNLTAMVAGGVLVATYPDGLVERRWQRWLVRGLWANLALPPLLLLTNPTLVFDAWLYDGPGRVPSPLAVSWLAPLGPPLAELYAGAYGIVLALPVLLARYLLAGQEQRRRMRLLVYFMATAMLIIMTGNALRWLGVPDDAPALLLIGTLYWPMVLGLPAIIVFGVLRYRLFDVDVAFRRSVVYGALTLGIAVAYVAVAAAPGLAFGSRIPVELAVLLTVVAAVAFQPLRRRLEAVADRLVFGAKVNRYQLLTAFGAGLEQTVDLPELLPRLADTVRRGLAAPWVRVSLPVSMPGAEAAAGEPQGAAALSVPLERDGQAVGRIECGSKDGGYDQADRELLTTLAAQATTAIANLRLTAQLAERLDELAASRARIVAAQDTERRRIERDIHDGVQQHVVALITKIRLARNALQRSERPADTVLAEVQADATELLADLRELAHGIHPPVLSDRGLVEAIETRADRLPIAVEVLAAPALRERRFGEEVEGAAYFVVCEALTNVVKHAAASTAVVELAATNGHLSILVRDDGTGAGAAAGSIYANGHGLTNLRDRVEALGGSLRIDGNPGTGTQLTAELPVGASRG